MSGRTAAAAGPTTKLPKSAAKIPKAKPTQPKQNGAPIRLVVPWKYGFKSIKSIVKIELVDYMPTSLWMEVAPNEYGFFATVNPDVPHPRWSQATERRIGESGRRETLLFNGYAEQVAHMYDDPNYDTTEDAQGL